MCGGSVTYLVCFRQRDGLLPLRPHSVEDCLWPIPSLDYGWMCPIAAATAHLAFIFLAISAPVPLWVSPQDARPMVDSYALQAVSHGWLEAVFTVSTTNIEM